MSENKNQGDFNTSNSALPSTGLNAEDIMGLVNDQRKLQNLAAVMEKLAPEVKKRVEFLRNIQVEYDEFESKFREERAALEAKYQKLYEPLYAKRYEIVNGLVEVEGVVDDSMEDIATEDKANEGNKGVPGFWLTAMKANEDLTEEIEINEQDEDALKHLKDIKCSKLDGDQRGFKLEFFFSPNPHFKNSVLSKTYLMFDDDDDEPILKKAIGSEIEWFPGRCLTEKVIKKKRKKGLKNAKLITKTEICLSFFNFFSPPNVPEENDVDFDEDFDEQLADQLLQDYEVGTIIRDKIIPHAVSWFTGEAEELEDIEGDEDDDDENDGEEDEEDDDEEGDEEGEEEDDGDDEDKEEEAKKRKFATSLKKAGECKQAVVSEDLCLAAWIM